MHLPRVAAAGAAAIMLIGVVAVPGRPAESALGDTLFLPAVIRDVAAGSQTVPAGTPKHPDFQTTIWGYRTNEVEPALGADRKPLASPTAATFASPESFGAWFSDTPYNFAATGPGAPVSHVFKQELAFTDIGSGIWEFTAPTFDPINGQGFGNYASTGRNHHFTMEMHASFVYIGGESLQVCSDDSMWVFINGTHVIDLGGVRANQCQNLAVDTLGLVPLQTYTFDLFYADRYTGEATVRVRTNLALFTPWRDEVPPTAASAVTVEATGPAGATVTAATLGATDQIGPGAPSPYPVAVTCVEPFGDRAVGTHTFHCVAVDWSGNQAAFTTTVNVVDTTAPTMAAPAPLSVEAVGPSTPVTFDAPIALDAVSGSITSVCAPPSGSMFPLGTTTVACTASDAAGNEASVTFTVTVADTTPPAFDPASSFTVEATGALTPVAFTSPVAYDLVDGSIEAVCSPPGGSAFAVGTTTVTCTAADGAGNAATVTFSVTVTDTTAPAMPPLPDIAVQAAGPGGAAVTWAPMVATDLVDGPVSASCTPASGTTFAVGTTTVTCTASDAAGNEGSGTFQVTVTAAPPPPPAGPTLQELVTGLNLNHGQKTALIATATAPGCGSTNGAKNLVEQHRKAGRITAAQATSLLTAIATAHAAKGCR